jgi:hypothetical protein
MVAADGVLDNVTSPGDSWIQKVRQCPSPDSSGWMQVAGLSQSEAQNLLDWLENRSLAEHELIFDPTAGFTVRWRARPA